MKLRHCGVCALLVCCSALWVTSSRATASPPPPVCDSVLTFSSNISSLSEGNGNIHSRSLSPWRWRSSTVVDRIPSTIWEAECSNSFCSRPNSGRTNGHELNSAPIYQNILVLNPLDRKGCYSASYQSVAVGCTCVRAVINHN